MKIPLKHEKETAAKRQRISDKIVLFFAVVLYAFLTATVVLAWFTPELELSVLRLSIASIALPFGWFYLLSDTAAKRHWEYVRVRVGGKS